MDNFNCKQHLKCGEWEKNQTLLQYQKEALRMKQNKNAIENMQSKEKNPSSWKILVEQSQWQFIESAITKYDECKQFASS